MDEKLLRFKLPEKWAEVDEWRRRQPDVPNGARAIRRMIDIVLRAEPQSDKAVK